MSQSTLVPLTFTISLSCPSTPSEHLATLIVSSPCLCLYLPLLCFEGTDPTELDRDDSDFLRGRLRPRGCSFNADLRVSLQVFLKPRGRLAGVEPVN